MVLNLKPNLVTNWLKKRKCSLGLLKMRKNLGKYLINYAKQWTLGQSFKLHRKLSSWKKKTWRLPANIEQTEQKQLLIYSISVHKQLLVSTLVDIFHCTHKPDKHVRSTTPSKRENMILARIIWNDDSNNSLGYYYSYSIGDMHILCVIMEKYAY